MNNIFFSKKGSGEAVSTLIMFIAVVSITTGLVIAFFNYTQNTQHSFDMQNKLTNNKLKTSITVTNVHYDELSLSLRVYVKNIGQTNLDTSKFDVFFNNEFIGNFSALNPVNLSEDLRLLIPYQTVTLVFNQTPDLGTNQIKVLTEYGVGDQVSFNH